jgi:hypothetical protein
LQMHAAKHSIWIAVMVAVTIGTLASRTEAQSAETTIACDKQEVRYRPFDSSLVEKITLSQTKDPLGLRAAESKNRSPQGTRYLLVQSADFSKPGPWTTTVLIGGIGLNGRLLKLSFIDHASGGVHLQWLNEKLLFIEVWWGRIASTDLILDVNNRTFLYKETAEYGDLIQPCH